MTNVTIQHRAFNNSIVGLVSFVITLLQTFLTVPILLGHWGNETYGVWLSLFAGFTLFQSVDNGHISYIGNKINLLYHTDKAGLKSTLGSSFLVAVLIGASQIGLISILILFNLLSTFLGISIESFDILSVPASLIILVAMWFVSGSFGGIIHRLMIPAGLYNQSLWWGILYRVCQFISIVLAVLFGGSILIVTIVYSFVQLIVYFFTFVYIKNKIPEFYPWWQDANWKTGFSNFNKSLLLTFNGITQQLSNNGVILFISNIISASVVPAFTTMRTITNTAVSITNILISSILPDIAKYHVKKETLKLNVIFNSHWFFSGIIVNIGLLMVLPFIKDIYQFWTKGLLQFDYSLFITLIASISLVNFGSGYFFYLSSINSLKAITLITVSRVLLVFGTGYFLIDWYGLPGIGIGIMTSEIISSTILPAWFVNRELKRNGNKIQKIYLLQALLPPFVIMIYSVIIIANPEMNYAVWIIFILILISLYIFNWFILDSEVKVRFKNLIRSLY